MNDASDLRIGSSMMPRPSEGLVNSSPAASFSWGQPPKHVESGPTNQPQEK
jgi:hypothetical protein